MEPSVFLLGTYCKTKNTQTVGWNFSLILNNIIVKNRKFNTVNKNDFLLQFYHVNFYNAQLKPCKNSEIFDWKQDSFIRVTTLLNFCCFDAPLAKTRIFRRWYSDQKVLLLLDGKCEVNLLIAKPCEEVRTHQILQYVERRGIKIVTKLMHFFPNKKCMYWRHFLWLCCLLPVLLGSVQVSSNNVTMPCPIHNQAMTRLEDMPTNQILDAGKMRRFQEFRKPSWRGWCKSYEN